MRPLEEHHWVFYGRLADPATAGALNALLDALPGVIGMTPFGERQVFVTSPTFRGFQMIAESHIAIHGDGLAARGEVFSCNPFDVERARREFAAQLGGEWVAEQLVRAMTPEAVASG